MPVGQQVDMLSKPVYKEKEREREKEGRGKREGGKGKGEKGMEERCEPSRAP
jgi:hypothetical protein